jgi:hypothetical protein
VLLAATVSCASRTDEGSDSAGEPEEEVPLDLTVDRVDIVHGVLRMSATMVEGSADVRMMRGGACERREIGGGISTRSRLIWALDERELTEALDCGLIVRARVQVERRYVTKTASLSVTADIAASVTEGSEEAPQLPAISSSSLARSVLARRPLVLNGASIETSLSVGGTVLEVEPSDVN